MFRCISNNNEAFFLHHLPHLTHTHTHTHKHTHTHTQLVYIVGQKVAPNERYLNENMSMHLRAWIARGILVKISRGIWAQLKIFIGGCSLKGPSFCWRRIDWVCPKTSQHRCLQIVETTSFWNLRKRLYLSHALQNFISSRNCEMCIMCCSKFKIASHKELKTR